MAAETSLLSSGVSRLVLRTSVSQLHSRFLGAVAGPSRRHRGFPFVDQFANHCSNKSPCAANPVSHSSLHRRCRTAVPATLQDGLVAEPRSGGGAQELLTWISNLPWPRVAIWATVALTASQFQDFFGVCNLLSADCGLAQYTTCVTSKSSKLFCAYLSIS